jgi:hypothetical protein
MGTTTLSPSHLQLSFSMRHTRSLLSMPFTSISLVPALQFHYTLAQP